MATSQMEPVLPMVVLYDYQVAAIVVILVNFKKFLDSYIVHSLPLQVSSIGTGANGIVAVFTRRLSTMNNPFGILTASQAVAETVLCGVFSFYFGPMMIA